MEKTKSKRSIAGCVGLVLPSFLTASLYGVVSSLARDYKVSGGISVGYERYDRQYDKNTDSASVNSSGEVTTTEDLTVLQDDEYDRLRAAPLVAITAISARDEASLRYSPSFRYDYDSYDHDLDHDLSAQVKRFISRDWQLKLTEKYLLTDAVIDQVSAAAETAVQLSDTTGRRKYWTNDLGFVSEYTYWEDSLFSFAYAYGILENIDVDSGSGYENYERHEGLLSVAHRLDSIWRMTVTAGYVRGLYDNVAADQTTAEENIDKDLGEYRASTMLEASLIDHHPLSLSYSYLAVDYDNNSLDTSSLQDVTLGWRWDISKELAVNLGGGPSYQLTEGQTGTWGYNARAGLQYAMEHSSIAVTASHGFDRQNFTGTNDNGLREFSQARVDYQIEIIKDVTLNVFTSYRYEDQEEITGQSAVAADVQATGVDDQIIFETEVFNRQRFLAGTRAGYRFWRWYTVNLSYDYVLQDSEKTGDSYDEHRLILSLSMEKELFSW